MGIAKDRNRQVPSRTLGLSCRAKGLDQEPRHVSPKPNPEPCDGHKGHKLNDASAELDHLTAETKAGALDADASHRCRWPHRRW